MQILTYGQSHWRKAEVNVEFSHNARPAESKADPADCSPDFGKAPRISPMIAVIVLAAGKSSRAAPENKLLSLMPSGRTLIEQTVDHAVASGAGPVIVVTGHQAEQVRNALSEKLVRFVHAQEFADGIAASLRAGIAALDSHIQGALICLGDMPLVSPSIMRRLAEAYDPGHGHEIIIPTFKCRRGNPVLWGRRFFPELLELTGDRGGRGIMNLHEHSITEMPVTSESVRIDFDTPAELARFRI